MVSGQWRTPGEAFHGAPVRQRARAHVKEIANYYDVSLSEAARRVSGKRMRGVFVR